MKLVSRDVKTKLLYLPPPNATSIAQPMDQGGISVIKRHYVHRYMNKFLAVIEDNETDVDIKRDRS